MRPNDMDYTEGSYTGQPTTGPSLPQARMILYVLCGLAVLAAVWIVLAAVFASQRTGTLAVSVADANAKVSIFQTGAAAKEIGQGSLKARIDPGSYSVQAVSGDKQTTKLVTVTKGQTTTVDLALQDLAPVTAIVPYNANSLYLAGTDLLFVNNETQTPFLYRSGEAAGRPYKPNMYPSARIAWITPTNFFLLKNRSWSYLANDKPASLQYGREFAADSEASSYNSKGGYAYVSNRKSVVAAASPATPAKKIATLKDTGGKTSLANDGSVLIFSTASASSDKAKLYRNGELSDVNASLSGTQHAEWSPDSNRFVYLTRSGLFVYDVTQRKATQISNNTQTNTYTSMWVDDGTIIFVEGQTIWKHSLKDQATVKLATVEGDLTAPRPFLVSADKQIVYFSTTKNTQAEGGYIYRILPNYNQLDASQRATLAKQGIQPANPAGAAPAATPAPTPLPTAYNGFDALLNIGVTVDQLSSIKYAVGQYVKASKPNAKQVTVVNGSLKSATRDRESGMSTVAFTISIDAASYPVRLEYSGISDTKVTIFSSNGTPVYSSR